MGWNPVLQGKESGQPGTLRLDALGVLSYSWNCEVRAHPQPMRSKACTAGLFCSPPLHPTRSKCCLRQNPSVPAGLERSLRQVSKDGKTTGEAGLAAGLGPGEPLKATGTPVLALGGHWGKGQGPLCGTRHKECSRVFLRLGVPLGSGSFVWGW